MVPGQERPEKIHRPEHLHQQHPHRLRREQQRALQPERHPDENVRHVAQPEEVLQPAVPPKPPASTLPARRCRGASARGGCGVCAGLRRRSAPGESMAASAPSPSSPVASETPRPGVGAPRGAWDPRAREAVDFGLLLSPRAARHPGDRAGVRPPRGRPDRRRDRREPEVPARGDARRPASSASSASSSPRSTAAPASATSSTCSWSPSCRKVDPSVGISVAAHNSLCTQPHLQVRQRGAAAPLGGAAGQGREDRRLEPDRARRRLRRRRHPHPRRAGGRRLGAQRLQDVHHPRHRSATSAWSSRSPTRTGRAHHNISAFVLEKGMEGFRPGKKENKLGIRASDTAEVVMENCFVPDDHLLGDAGRGLHPGAADPRRRPHLDRRAGARHGASAPSTTALALRQGARAVRQADRRVPGDPVRARRDGDPHRRGRDPDLRRGRGHGPRPAR